MSSHDNQDIEIKLECPYCPGHKESKLFLNTDLGIFHCYRCDFKGTVRSLKYTHPELFEQVKDLVSLAAFGRLKAFNKVESDDTEIEADLSSSSFITSDDAQYQYLLNRGWTEENIFAYTPLKADSLKFYNRVIIPVVNNDNNLIYYTARDISGKSKRKYLNPESDKNFIFTSKTSLNTVYSEDAFICEGIFDAFKTPNACALMGKTLNKKQHKVLYDFLKPKKNIYICLDPGTLKECKRLAEELDIWFPTKQIYIMNWVSTDEDIDLGDLSKTLSSKELVKYIKENSNLAA